MGKVWIAENRRGQFVGVFARLDKAQSDTVGMLIESGEDFEWNERNDGSYTLLVKGALRGEIYIRPIL